MTGIFYIRYLDMFDDNFLVMAELPVDEDVVWLDVCNNFSVTLQNTIGYFTGMNKVFGM